MCVFLFVWVVICVCYAIIRVELIYLVFVYLIGRFLSCFGGLIVGHEGMGKSEVSLLCSVWVDECSVDDFICSRGWLVEDTG